MASWIPPPLTLTERRWRRKVDSAEAILLSFESSRQNRYTDRQRCQNSSGICQHIPLLFLSCQSIGQSNCTREVSTATTSGTGKLPFFKVVKKLSMRALSKQHYVRLMQDRTESNDHSVAAAGYSFPSALRRSTACFSDSPSCMPRTSLFSAVLPTSSYTPFSSIIPTTIALCLQTN